MMKRMNITKILDQKKPAAHIMLFLVTLIAVLADLYIHSGSIHWYRSLSVFILIFIQLELFILIARMIFRELVPGISSREFTRIVLSRFALFFILCFVAAFVVTITFTYVEQLIWHGSLSNVLPGFFASSFSGWIKSTFGGLLFGAGIFIIVLWQDALKREQKLREENLIFQNITLKNQVNPHFLFNSLNTLSSLIVSQPEIAEKFTGRLSSIYRYILENSSRDKVRLEAEISFIRDYFYLHQIRDDDKIKLNMDIAEPLKFEILPVSLQILVENAIKHNKATRQYPLKIEIYIDRQYIVVRNNLQKMASQFKSTGIGLPNLARRVKLISGKDLIIEETDNFFTVKLPLL